MSETYDIRKLGGDKIALLGLFAISLLTARLVVGLKSALILSEPILLQRAGLSISVPTGNGWKRQEGWATDGSSFILSSSFSSGPAHETAGVICMYRSARGMATPTTRFEQRARENNGRIVEINRMVTDSLIFDWARVEGDKSPLTMFLATTILPDSRQLDIEVCEITGDAELAERVFNRVVESVNLEENRLRTATPGTT
ncbi:MAG: hypothetical protein ACYSWQ_28520 [Planctomycetota bacterium]